MSYFGIHPREFHTKCLLAYSITWVQRLFIHLFFFLFFFFSEDYTSWQSYCQSLQDQWVKMSALLLTHWGQVTHICVDKFAIIGSDNGLSPGRRQDIIWTSDSILLIALLGTNFNELLIEIHTFSFKKINLKLLAGKWWLFCFSLNESNDTPFSTHPVNLLMLLLLLKNVFHLDTKSLQSDKQ